MSEADLIRDMAHDLRVDGNELEADALTDLLAENERLREALKWISANDERGWFGDRARDALATQEKP